MSLRVVLADDHVPTRKGVRSALEAHGMTVCAEAGTSSGAVQAALDHNPDICVLDVRMPGDGVIAAAEIAERLPETAIVMLSAHNDDSAVFAALRAGARGFLLKDTNPERLPIALKGVLAGEAAIPRQLMMRIVEEFQRRERRRRIPFLKPGGEALTDREWEVLELMGEEFTTKEIANKLGISDVTVRRHISVVLRKLRVKNREEALKLIKTVEA